MDKYFNSQQAAKYLRITEQALQHMLAGGKIPAVKTPSNVYIFKKNDIDEWLRNKRSKVKGLLEGIEVL